MTRLDIDGLIATLDTFRHKLFRMEQLMEYAVDDDGDDYHRWIAGEPEPTWSRKQPWLDVLRTDRAAGRDRRRVRILSAELNDYQLYEVHWGYALNQPAGEDIRVLRPDEHEIPHDRPLVDFWVIDDDAAVTMNYDARGEFVDAAIEPDPRPFFTARDAVWAAAEPFDRWWTRHPELHDTRTATA